MTYGNHITCPVHNMKKKKKKGGEVLVSLAFLGNLLP